MKQWIDVALPKGRLGENVYKIFDEAGYSCPSILETNRKLIFENEERGAADVGVAGKDIILEYEPDVFELADLNMGKCRMCVAGHKGFRDNTARTLRVATKFPNIAKEYYAKKSRQIDIIKLNGSIELAPILRMSDVIVDIVETGTTLKENNLEVLEEILPISARLISNKVSYKFKNNEIMELCDRINEICSRGDE